MKNQLLILIAVITLISCNTEKKTLESNKIDAVMESSSDAKVQKKINITHLDSSITTKSIIENSNEFKSINIEFDLKDKPTMFTKIPNSNDSFLYHLLNKSSKVKIGINYIQQNSNSQLLTRQNNIKSAINSTINKQKTFKQEHRVNIKSKNKASSESKTRTTIVYWLIAKGLILSVYFLNKLNIPALLRCF